MIYTLILLFYQVMPPLQPPPEPTVYKQALDALVMIGTPLAVICSIVAIVYFFWHSKNREELTKALAEATSLAETRGKRISDLKEEISHTEIVIGKKEATITLHLKTIGGMEIDDERRAKTEFRLRAEITDLEKRLGIGSHHAG